MEKVQHDRIIDCGKLRDPGRNWVRLFLVPQWRQSSRTGPVSGTMEDLGADLQSHPARQRWIDDIWKGETTNIRLRMDSRDPCRNYSDLYVGNGMTGWLPTLYSPVRSKPLDAAALPAVVGEQTAQACAEAC